MLPRHGVAYAVFLLAHVSRYTARGSIEEWVQAARSRGSYMAAATDLRTPAEELFKLRLAKLEGGVVVAPQLMALAERADRNAMLGIARLLLTIAPPVWLSLAVSESGVFREYIPRADLDALEWLEPDLDVLLFDAGAMMRSDRRDTLRKLVGDAAELFLMAALSAEGLHPVHVALLSDAYGYDIEVSDGGVDRIEVKAAVPRTRGCFHLTRNEFEKSRTYGSQWRILQVVFKSSALVANILDKSHVDGVYEISSAAISQLVPDDTSEFKWTDSAIMTPPSRFWRPIDIALTTRFCMPGFGVTKLQEADRPLAANNAPREPHLDPPTF